MKEKEQDIRKRNKHTVYVRCFSGFNVSFDFFVIFGLILIIRNHVKSLFRHKTYSKHIFSKNHLQCFVFLYK